VSTNNVVELTVKMTDAFTGPLQNIHNALDRLARRFTGLGIDAVASFAAIGKAFETIFQQSTQAEVAAVKFGAAFDAMGAHIGIAREEMEKFAKTAEENTRFSREQVQGAQTVLLRFVDVQGVVFERAQKLSLDLAEAMGGDAAGAAQLLGRAMESPILSARLLRQVGIYLTEQQKEQVKAFTESGHQMEAQKIVLDELQKRYGGLADKIGNTTAGKVAELTHAFDDLFKVQDQFGPLNEAVDGLTKSLKDPDVKQNIQSTFGLLISLASTALGIINKIAEGWRLIWSTAVHPPGANSWLGIDFGNKAFTDARAQSQAATGSTGQPDWWLQNGGDAASSVDLSKVRGGGQPFSGSYSQKTQSDAAADATRAKQASDEAFDAWVRHLQDVQELQDSVDKQMQKITEDVQNSEGPVGSVAKQIQLALDGIQGTYKGLGEYTTAQLQAIAGIQNAFAAAFNSIGAGIKGMLRAFLEAIRQVVTQAAAANLTDAIFGKVDPLTHHRTGGGGGLSGTLLNALGGSWSGGSGGASTGGFFSDLIHGLFSLFSGGGTPAGGTGADFASAGTQFAASGGDISAGLTLVGENGPELIGTGGPARVWNNQQLAFAMGNGGGVNYSHQTVFNITGSVDSRVKADLIRYVEAARAHDKREVVRVLNERKGLRR